MIKVRSFPELNYRAIFLNGKTIRQRYSQTESFLSQPFPEIEDVAINTLCKANCSYCYVSAIKNGKNFDSVVEKINDYYGKLLPSHRPFQVAIGGAGEPTLHPDFSSILRAYYDLGIMPNYTTNGMHLSKDTLEATKQYSGGVAVSYHPHLEKTFHKAVDKLLSYGIKTNIHLILGAEDSLKAVKSFTNDYKDKVDYVVILPYQVAGRAKDEPTESIWDSYFGELKDDPDRPKNLAFGALFYPYLQKKNLTWLDLDMYEPEVFSGYRLMDDSYTMLRKSSYDLRAK